MSIVLLLKTLVGNVVHMCRVAGRVSHRRHGGGLVVAQITAGMVRGGWVAGLSCAVALRARDAWRLLCDVSMAVVLGAC